MGRLVRDVVRVGPSSSPAMALHLVAVVVSPLRSRAAAAAARSAVRSARASAPAPPAPAAAKVAARVAVLGVTSRRRALAVEERALLPRAAAVDSCA